MELTSKALQKAQEADAAVRAELNDQRDLVSRLKDDVSGAACVVARCDGGRVKQVCGCDPCVCVHTNECRSDNYSRRWRSPNGKLHRCCGCARFHLH